MAVRKVMQAVILAAGKGSRLHPLTFERTKAMLPILGRPIIARVMETLIVNGLREFILVISPDDREIRDYFEQESSLDVRVQFVVQPERRGMADALTHAAALIQEDFMLSACDNLVAKEDVGRLLSRWDATPRPDGLLTLMEVPPDRIRSVGIVELEGDRVTRILEKPDPSQAPGNVASLPLYLFSARILEYLPQVPLSARGEYELQDAIQLLIERGGRVHGQRISGRLTLTSPADLLTINRHYLVNAQADLRTTPKQLGANSRLRAPLYIESGVVIGTGCEIGPNVYIERDCRIGDSVRIRNSILLREVSIPSGEQIEDRVVAP